MYVFPNTRAVWPISSFPSLRWSLLVGIFLVLNSGAASSAPISLPEVERLALQADPELRELRSQVNALRELAVARAQLPDPSLKLGAAALPIDTFDLDQEPMTQLQLGVRQQFPPGKTLVLRGEHTESAADAMEARILDAELAIVRDVRTAFVEIQYRERGQAILANAREILEEITEIVRDYYANGRAQQHDVLLAELEVARLDDRLLRMRQAQEEARATLSQWIGSKAQEDIPAAWASVDNRLARETLPARVQNHPRIVAAEHRIRAAESAVNIAREQYKPGWAVELTYGDRSGNNADGRARSDFLFASVSVDLPLFRGARQDRMLSSSAEELNAETARLEDHRRRLTRDLDRSLATLDALTDRLALYKERLIPQAQETSKAALAAYQSDVGDFSTLLRSQISEFELQLDLERAEADQRQVLATLNYLTGDGL